MALFINRFNVQIKKNIGLNTFLSLKVAGVKSRIYAPCVEKENFSIEEDLINVALGKSLAFDDGLASD